ncbi:MAG TPA: amidohydrolase family protein, partial [Clostridia bacterium]|nr:amidohydrolase family protein [Clostridia bacterium]
MKADLVINASTIVCCTEGEGAGVIENGYVAVKDRKIISLGEGNAPGDIKGPGTRIIDAAGKTVTPGLIDAHTHLVHGGSREKELPLKLKGVPYL